MSLFSQYFNYSYVCIELQLHNLALCSINKGIGHSGEQSGEVLGGETGLQLRFSSANLYKNPVHMHTYFGVQFAHTRFFANTTLT